MPSEIVMPRMGLTMETGTIIQWLKQEGETVAAGEPLLEIETDKASVEIEALEGGTLHKILAGPGEEILVGAVIGHLLRPGELAAEAVQEVAHGVAGVSPLQVSIAPGMSSSVRNITVPDDRKVKASPAARKLAKSLGVELAQLKGSGPNGRVVAWNVAEIAQEMLKDRPASIATKPSPRISPVAQRVAAESGVDIAEVQGSGPGGAITRRDVELAAQKPVQSATAANVLVEGPTIAPLTRIQRLTAERMTHSFGTAPHFYLHAEADARQMVTLRQLLLPRLEQSDNVHLTFTDLLIYFCGRILPRHPLVMAQWTPDGLKQFHRVHIGIAVETGSGLLVPTLRDADKLGLAEIARGRSDLAERARSAKLLPDEFEGGVFTITNLGMYRVDSFDAILNPPQAGILAAGQIKERALVENGQVIPAPMLNLSLSVDHRVLDGARAARFLSDLVEMIEVPGLSMR